MERRHEVEVEVEEARRAVPRRTIAASAARLLALAGCVIVIAGCGPDRAPDDQPGKPRTTLQDGVYRATLASTGGELPFGLEIAHEQGRRVAYLVNGPERVRVPEVAVDGDRVTMNMPGFLNRIEARIDGDQLVGEFISVKRDTTRRLPLFAQRGLTWRFSEKPAPPAADLTGRWAATFTSSEDGSSYEAVGEFSQHDGAITGTFLTPTGDHRFLAGEVSADALALSTFDGGHGFLYKARLQPDGTLHGTLWSGLGAPVSFVAKRDASASLGAAEQKTAMRSGARTLDFRFPDLDGAAVSLDDARFAGKVVVIALAGSWCPNCHDEAAFLAKWYRENRQRGVEVVSLMFEQFGDFPQAVASTRRFRDRYGIEYTTLIAGISDKDDAAAKLPQLNGVYAFPTTIFVDRRGTVRRIHTGFSGPATGKHFEALQREFERTVDELVGEPGSLQVTVYRRPS